MKKKLNCSLSWQLPLPPWPGGVVAPDVLRLADPLTLRLAEGVAVPAMDESKATSQLPSHSGTLTGLTLNPSQSGFVPARSFAFS